jgi:hypothetical protein
MKIIRAFGLLAGLTAFLAPLGYANPTILLMGVGGVATTTMDAPTTAEGASFNFATACSGSCLVAEDTFTEPTLNTSLWEPFVGCCSFGHFSADVFNEPY